MLAKKEATPHMIQKLSQLHKDTDHTKRNPKNQAFLPRAGVSTDTGKTGHGHAEGLICTTLLLGWTEWYLGATGIHHCDAEWLQLMNQERLCYLPAVLLKIVRGASSCLEATALRL